eukprot:7387559-Prymnesium_polylepis.3
MSEMLWFLFELAREHLPAPERPAGAPPGAKRMPPPEGAYLEDVVRPLYMCVFHETFSGVVGGRPRSIDESKLPAFPKNYDDWNESLEPWIARYASHALGKGAAGINACGTLAHAGRCGLGRILPRRQEDVPRAALVVLLDRRESPHHCFTFGICFMAALPPEWNFNE